MLQASLSNLSPAVICDRVRNSGVYIQCQVRVDLSQVVLREDESCPIRNWYVRAIVRRGLEYLNSRVQDGSQLRIWVQETVEAHERPKTINVSFI
jgi:hypothetical protein